jgi:hypothetical protein
MKFTEFSISDNLVFEKYASKRINIAGEPVRFQIPRMYMPFGISGFVPSSGPTKWNIDFSMKGHDEDGNEVKTFYEFLTAIEHKVIEHIQVNSADIFGSRQTFADLQLKFNSNIKTTPGREPKFRVKVDTVFGKENEIKPCIFNATNVQVLDRAVSGLFSRHSGTAIVELGSVYFMNGKFGLTWRLHQLKVFEPQHLKGFQIEPEDEEARASSDTGVKGFLFQI